jgi:nucleotide-binding universal stress UspA family protein
MVSQPPLGPPYKIVVGVDYSDASRLALHAAFEIALRRRDAQLYALAVAEGMLSRPEEIVDEAKRAFHDEAQKTLESYLTGELDAFEKTGRRLNRMRVGASVDFGNASERILAFSEELLADLIVLGTHGKTALERLVVGSVTEEVLRHARCPVLATRPKRHETGAA